MVNRLILQIIAGIASLWLAVRLIPEVEFLGEIKYLLLAGAVLGLINFFLKPILKLITLPLRMLTFGLFTLVINMAMIWIVDIFFQELIIPGIIPLFWTTIIIWAVSFFLGLYTPRRKTAIEEQ
ncbi:MAG: phage holin family protein [bacterium]